MVDVGRPKFFSRHSSGRYPLEMAEIRSAFNASETVQSKLRAIHGDRLASIVAGRTSPFSLGNSPKTVLHLIPLSSVDPTNTYDVAAIKEDVRMAREYIFMPSINSSHERWNIEGYQVYCLVGEKGNEQSTCYVQLFRNGIIEAVESYVLGAIDGWEGKKIIANVAYESQLIHAVKKLIDFQKQLGVEPPIVLMLSLLGLAEYRMEPPDVTPWYRVQNYTINHDPLLLPDVMIESYDEPTDRLLRPVFDALWNASGYPRCPHYDMDGNWKAPRER